MEKYPLVNWVNGMKINKDTFLTMENALMDRINWARACQLSPIEFGLFIMSENQSNTVEIDLQLTGRNTILLNIHSLLALTRGGALINIGKNGSDTVQLSYTIVEDMSTDKSYSIVVGVDPFSRFAVGDADPTEEPPRQPYVTNQFTVSLIPFAEDANSNIGAFHLPVGMVHIIDGVAQVDANYIPPSMSLSAHPSLKQHFHHCDRLVNDLEGYCISIRNKIYARNQKNILSEIIGELCKEITNYSNYCIPEIKRSLVVGKPIRMIEIVAGLGRTIKGVIDVRQNCGKEEVLNYFSDWRDLNQAKFEQAISQLIVVEYTHTNCAPAFSTCHDFLLMLTDLFKKLSELDYIGDQQDASVFVKEESPEEEELLKKRRRFF